MSEKSDPFWRPTTLDECADFWRLHLWTEAHPGEWTLDQVYARMLEINEGPPTAHDLDVSSRVTGAWLKGIGFLRLAELHGDLALDHDQRYLTAFIGLEPGLQLPLMRADRELREELVWGMLRQEGNRGVSLSSSDRSASMGSEQTPGWSRTFEASVNEGLIERDRLLDALLEMLVADLPSARAGWYSRTLRLLAMTIDEAEARQSTLCALMSSPVGATVTLAVGHLSALARAGRLDLELFARSCEGALMGSKANALAALTILRGGLEVLSPGGIEPLLAIALSFPHAQVQALAIELVSDALRSGLLDPATVGRLLSDAELDPLVVATLDLLDLGHTATGQAGPGLAPEEDTGEQAPAAFLPPPREVTDLVPMSADDVVGQRFVDESSLLGFYHQGV